mgnify:CR=1 FL=1
MIEEVVVVIDDEEVVAKEGKWEGEQKQKENVESLQQP